jgi:hypothetical protein
MIFNSYTTGVTSGTGTAYPSGAPEFTLVFSGVRVTRSLYFCVVTSETYPWSFVIQIFHSGQPSHGGDRKAFEVMTSDYVSLRSEFRVVMSVTIST